MEIVTYEITIITHNTKLPLLVLTKDFHTQEYISSQNRQVRKFIKNLAQKGFWMGDTFYMPSSIERIYYKFIDIKELTNDK